MYIQHYYSKRKHVDVRNKNKVGLQLKTNENKDAY